MTPKQIHKLAHEAGFTPAFSGALGDSATMFCSAEAREKFAQAVRNATLEEAAAKCGDAAALWVGESEWLEGCEHCAKEIRSLKT